MAAQNESGGEIFIVDNSDVDWQVREYLREWAEVARAFDVATGYFEIGALLALDGQWQKLDKIRILLGDEVTSRTRRVILEGVTSTATQKLDASLEHEKEKDNDFLRGVPAIVAALQSGQIECRVFAEKKFHAKAYITHAKARALGSFALVGSSNFTLPGLSDNIELNIQVRQRVGELQDWYERHWEEAVDVSGPVLKVIERHARDFSPFEVYARALHELFRKSTPTAGQWEENGSKLYNVLDYYQREGYHQLLEIARSHRGAFLCDGVGLGKTFVGMMVIERLLWERQKVVLLVPKAALEPVWKSTLKKYLPEALGVWGNLRMYSHTDLGRPGLADEWAEIQEQADAIVIDEAHHFRNPGVKGEGARGPSRYRRLFDIAEGKSLFLLTATPVNNRLIDLQHMIELFSRGQSDYFARAPLGIHSLPGHFRKMERDLVASVGAPPSTSNGDTKNGKAAAPVEMVETNEVEAEAVLSGDALFRELVVQRSRAYVKRSQEQQGGDMAAFPVREDPRVAEYSVKKTYGRLLQMIEDAFSKEKPLFSLAIYYPLFYYKGPDADIDPLAQGRQQQVVGLIKIGFLKRFESSARAFEVSCHKLLLKLLAWATKHSRSDSEKRRLERWKAQHADLVGYVQQFQLDLFADEEEEGDEAEDIITSEMLGDVQELSCDEYKVDEMLNETFLDLDQIAYFLEELKKFKPAHDDKLRKLKSMLKSDAGLKGRKVLLFTQFTDTARYLKQQLKDEGIVGVDEVDGGDSRDRGEVIRRFAPYYNGSSSAQLEALGHSETRILISTDVLSEGLNLQDATRLINYDLHWNPVRLMQRIGRVDRRMNSTVEDAMLADHPELKNQRGVVAYWNFLPPDELDSLLELYARLSRKALLISKTFGIEGSKLLHPEDDFDALKDFTRQYEGTTTPLEEMHLEYQKLLASDPDLAGKLDALPNRIFSGKAHPDPKSRGVFFCYVLPAPAQPPQVLGDGAQALQVLGAPEEWTEAAGEARWYLYDLESQSIGEEATDIARLVRSTLDTPRHLQAAPEELKEIRQKVERHIKNSYLRSVNAPAGVKPILKCWMEIG
jgi:superfamily II DNA or RNA helicase